MAEKLPLLELTEKMLTMLAELRYTDEYIYYLRLLCGKLLAYADGIGTEYMTEELKDAFVHDLYSAQKKASAARSADRCAEMLLMVQEYGTILYHKPSDDVFTGPLGELYENFISTYNGKVKESTVATYRTRLKVSADYLADNNITDINDITPDVIVNFTIKLSKFSGKSATSIMSLFAKMLRYVFERGFSTEDKSLYCMKVQFYDGEKIPSTFTTVEITRLLDSIDRSTPIGKRDYAMIMLSTRTALRPCDIIGLKLEHLRFDTDTIEITQQKTSKSLTLPLSEETGSALIEYLRNGRPNSESDAVFLRNRAPYKPFKNRGDSMIRRRMEQAGIENYKERQPGFRAFRHSLAGNMLNNNISIYKIQNFLGHTSPNTTMRYVKIDVKGLKNCALEVPIRQS